MTPRERVLSVLEGLKPDCVPWFGDLDYWATSLIRLGKKPEGFIRSADYIDWHRDLGVGFYLQGYFPYQPVYSNCKVTDWQEGNRRYRRIDTPVGFVRECWEYIPSSFTEAPVEHFCKTASDIPAMTHIYRNLRWEPDYGQARERAGQVGDQGIVLCYLPKSPFMQLVALEAGISAVTELALTCPDDFAGLLVVMEESSDRAARIALESPAEALMIPENLSSEMVGPYFFESYMRAYQEKWTTEIRKAGKYSIIHIDGTLRGLLREEASAGFTVLEALTPIPVGDVEFSELSALADSPQTILWGGIPGVYFTPHVNDTEFRRHVREILGIMCREPRYVLGVADQIPPDALESRVREVGELTREFGTCL